MSEYNWLEPLDRRIKQTQEETEAIKKETAALILERENRMDKHSAWIQEGIMKMANNEDPYYTEAFKTREEVEDFIAYLRLKADEAWPN